MLRRTATFLFLSSLVIFSNTNHAQDDDKRIAAPAPGQLAASAANGFAFGLFNKTDTRTSKGNKVLSPLSAHIAMSMAYSGTLKETQLEMGNAMGITRLGRDKVNAAYNELLTSLNKRETYTLKLANSVWHREDCRIEPQFTERMKSYSADVRGLDFSSPDASKEINRWVSDRTNEKIKSIVPERLPAGAKVYLINATYLKGAWQQQFSKGRTKEGDFHVSKDETIPVPMMHHTGRYKVNLTKSLETVELAIGKRNEASVIIAQPRGPRNLEQFAKGMDVQTWNGLVSDLRRQPVRYGNLSIPKIVVNYQAALNNSLQALGIRQAFTDRAEFGDLTPANVWITSVLQKTFLDMNEQGVEAAAVTAVGFGTTNVEPTPAIQFNLNIDRPYLLAIVDNATNAILFLATIEHPEGGTLPAQP